jgi:hypothetical protein
MGIAYGIKKAPVKDDGNLMILQRNNPYCDLITFECKGKKDF